MNYLIWNWKGGGGGEGECSVWPVSSGADPGGGGGGPEVQGPPLVPRDGVLDPSSKMKKTAFIIFSFI